MCIIHVYIDNENLRCNIISKKCLKFSKCEKCVLIPTSASWFTDPRRWRGGFLLSLPRGFVAVCPRKAVRKKRTN